MKICLNIENSQDDLPLKLENVYLIVSHSISYLNVKAKSLNIYFLDPISIRNVHKDFFGDDSLTDCMSFPIENNGKPPFSCDLLGEIFISTKAAIDYCKKNNSDQNAEIMRYIVHGILHLCGFDDKTKFEKEQMYNIQEKLLSDLISNGILLLE